MNRLSTHSIGARKSVARDLMSSRCSARRFNYLFARSRQHDLSHWPVKPREWRDSSREDWKWSPWLWVEMHVSCWFWQFHVARRVYHPPAKSLNWRRFRLLNQATTKLLSAETFPRHNEARPSRRDPIPNETIPANDWISRMFQLQVLRGSLDKRWRNDGSGGNWCQSV